MTSITWTGHSAEITRDFGARAATLAQDIANTSIVDCRRLPSAPDEVRPGESAEYAVFVQNTNNSDIVVTVEFLVEGDIVEEATEVIDANDTQRITAPVTFAQDIFDRVFFGPNGQERINPEVRIAGKTDPPQIQCQDITLVQPEEQQQDVGIQLPIPLDRATAAIGVSILLIVFFFFIR